MTYAAEYNRRTPDGDQPADTRRSTPETPLQAAIAAVIDQAAGMAGGGNPDHRSFDLNAMEADIRTYCERRALYGTSPSEYINAVGVDKIAECRGFYRFGQSAGLRIAHDDELRREQKERLREAIFGDDFVPMKTAETKTQITHQSGVWPNAQAHLMPGYQ